MLAVLWRRVLAGCLVSDGRRDVPSQILGAHFDPGFRFRFSFLGGPIYSAEWRAGIIAGLIKPSEKLTLIWAHGIG